MKTVHYRAALEQGVGLNPGLIGLKAKFFFCPSIVLVSIVDFLVNIVDILAIIDIVQKQVFLLGLLKTNLFYGVLV